MVEKEIISPPLLSPLSSLSTYPELPSIVLSREGSMFDSIPRSLLD